MKREEAGLTVVVAIVLAIFIAIIFTNAVVWLVDEHWFGDGSDVIQWASLPPTFAVIIGYLWHRWHNRCGTVGCVRQGEHPVAGTTKKVCTHHHTREHHELVHALHHVEGRFGWGDTHTKGTP